MVCGQQICRTCLHSPKGTAEADMETADLRDLAVVRASIPGLQLREDSFDFDSSPAFNGMISLEPLAANARQWPSAGGQSMLQQTCLLHVDI